MTDNEKIAAAVAGSVAIAAVITGTALAIAYKLDERAEKKRQEMTELARRSSIKLHV